jgi:hypothetical protein
MSALLWWLIPLAATVIALLWAAARSRPRRAADTHETVGDMARFRAAMRRPLPSERLAAERRRRPAASRPGSAATPPASGSTSRPGRTRRPADRRHPA